MWIEKVNELVARLEAMEGQGMNEGNNRSPLRRYCGRQITFMSRSPMVLCGACAVQMNVPISCIPNRDQVIIPTKGTTYDPADGGMG
jgi:hypothetical protein